MNEKLLDRPMPHSEDAEASAIGTMLIDPDAAAIVAAELKADDFFLIRTKTIFATICAMLERGWPLDEITVTDELARKGVLDQCGGRDYISRIILRTPSAVGAESYCRMIRDYAVQRELIAAAGNVLQLGYNGGDGGGLDWAGKAVGVITKVMDKVRQRSPEGNTTMSQQYQEHLDNPHTAIPTPWPALNNMLFGGGFMPTDLVVVTGREGLGKTTMALNLLLGLYARMDENGETIWPRTIMYQFEMPSFQIAIKSLSIVTGIPTWKLEATQKPTLTRDDLKQIEDASPFIDGQMKCVDDADGDIDKLLGKMKEGVKRGYDVFCVDILQELFVEREISENHTTISICKKLRAFARTNKVVVILLAHMRKSKKEDQDAPPTLADLKGGGIAGNATVVLALHSPTYNMPGQKRPVEDIDIHIVKNRMGKRGTVKMQWIPDTGKYREWRPQ